MAHRNARLAVHGRHLIVTRVIEEGWSVPTAAEAAGASRATVYKWLARFREHGETGLQDRSSRPRSCPNRLDAKLEARILLARKRRRWGPHTLEFYLGVPRSTAYKVLVRNGCSRLADFDRPTGKPIRYVKDRPGELLHVDVKQLGRIPEGGGRRVHGREGVADRSRKGGLGYDKLHVAVDDHSRLAFVQVHPDERGKTCAAFLADAIAWFDQQGIAIQRGHDRPATPNLAHEAA